MEKEINTVDELIQEIQSDDELLKEEKEVTKMLYVSKADDIINYLSNPENNDYYVRANPYENREPPQIPEYKSKWSVIKSNFKKLILSKT